MSATLDHFDLVFWVSFCSFYSVKLGVITLTVSKFHMAGICPISTMYLSITNAIV